MNERVGGTAVRGVAPTTVVGRDDALGQVDRFLADAGGTLVVEGEPGIGKTTVWRAAIAAAEAQGYAVLTARPAETEAKLSFSAVADLAEPLLDGLSTLPGLQRRALEVALLRSDPGDTPPEIRAVAVAFRSLLAIGAEAQPLLLAVDDAQWLDSPSATVIVFAVRRAESRVSLLATRRPGHALDDVLGDGDPIRLEPMTLAAIHHVVRQGLGASLPRPVITRVHETSAGNPFFALQLAKLALDSRLRPGSPLPVPSDLAEAVRNRVEQLRPETRELLLTVAAAAVPSRELLGRVHGGIEESLEEAEEAGIVEADDDLVRFAHPLYSAAVYSSAGQERRRRIHAELAQSLVEPEEQARHLALSATPPDEEAARRVHAAARVVAARGAPAAAAELLEQAIRLAAPESRLAAERLVDLGEYLHTSGDSIRAIEALRRVETWTHESSATQIRGFQTLAEAVYWTEGGYAAVATGEEFLRAAKAPEIRAALHAKISAHQEFDMARALEHADAALTILEPLGDDADPATLALALGMRARNRLGLGLGLEREPIERAIRLEGAGEIAHSYGQWLKYVDDFDGSRRWLEKRLREHEQTGDDADLPNVFQQLAMTECWAGNLALAGEHAERACMLADEVQITAVGPQRTRAIVEAHRGNETEVRVLAQRIRDDGWSGPITLHLEIALGLLELSLGNLVAADEHLRTAITMAEQMGQLEPGVHRVHGDAAEVALALGDRDRAIQIAAFLEEHGSRTGHAWSTAVAARTRALISAYDGDYDASFAALEDALATHERLPMPYERARTLLAKGQIERRARRRGEARGSLEHARAIFEEIGATLWAARASDELVRIPIRRGASDQLTGTEERVAELAASGMTNKEVAKALFISPKTVEANLARVYRKLGIRSRAELGARMGSGPAEM